MTQRIDPTWLDAVPRLAEDEAQGEVIVLQGWLVRAPAGRVRLAIREVCLEFHVEDVVGVREQAAAPDARAFGAISAELRLRPGASLLAVHDLAALQAHDPADLREVFGFAADRALRPRRRTPPPRRATSSTIG